EINPYQIVCRPRIAECAPVQDLAPHFVVVLGHGAASRFTRERSEIRREPSRVYPSLIGEPGYSRGNRSFTKGARVDFGQILQLKDYLNVAPGDDSAHHRLAIFFVFDYLPRVHRIEVTPAKGRTTICVKDSFFGFVQHGPNLKAVAEAPAATMQGRSIASRLRERTTLMRLFGERVVSSFVRHLE